MQVMKPFKSDTILKVEVQLIYNIVLDSGVQLSDWVVYIYIYIYSFFLFWSWTIFKVFIAFVIILLLLYVLVFWPRGLWDLSFPSRDQTCTGRWSLNHWTGRKVHIYIYTCTHIYIIFFYMMVYYIIKSDTLFLNQKLEKRFVVP